MTKEDEVKGSIVMMLMEAQEFFAKRMKESDKVTMIWCFDDAPKEEQNAFYGGIQQAMIYVNKLMDDPVFPVDINQINISECKGVH